MAYSPMGYFPPPGYGPGYPPMGGGVPPYPGPPGVNFDPRFQHNPSYDGLFSHGLTTSPYLNSQLEDINMIQYQIYAASGVGYAPPYPPGFFPPPGFGQPMGFGPPGFGPPGYWPPMGPSYKPYTPKDKGEDGEKGSKH